MVGDAHPTSVGCWLFVVCCWLLVICCWLFVVGFFVGWALPTTPSIAVAKRWSVGFRYRETQPTST